MLDLDSEDYELYVIQTYGVEAWIDHLRSLNQSAEFEQCNFLECAPSFTP